MQYLIIVFVSGLMFLSVWQYINFQHRWTTYRLHISFELFYTLLIIYASVIIGFGIIYFILSMDREMLLDPNESGLVSVPDLMLRSMYFSGVTMLTIGYGDIVPVGIGRLIAIVQALVGYLLPTTFVLKLVQLNIDREVGRHTKPKE